MAKKKKEVEIIGYVDANGNASDTFRDVEVTQPKKNNIIGYVDINGKASETMPEDQQIRSVQSTVDGLNKVSNSIKQNKKKTEEPQEENKIKDLYNKGNYITQSGLSGVVSSLTGMASAPLQYIQEGAERSREVKTRSKDEQKLDATLKTISNFVPESLRGETLESINAIMNDKNKNNLKKGIDIGLQVLPNILGSSQVINTLKNTGESFENLGIGDTPKNIRKAIETPTNNYNEMVQRQGQNYGTITRGAGELAQVIGNMAPSMTLSAITGDPTLGLAAMGIGAKGQATTEAEQKGATLQEANAIGYAKGATEIGTEALTGGLNFFGKGALDDIATKGINKFIPQNKVLNFVAKKFAGIGGEILEEEISDTVGYAIDKATTDPNAKWSWSDRGKTALMTMLSTGILNSISGGYGRNSYQLNAQELNQIAQNKQVQQRVNQEMNNIDTSKMSNKQIEATRQQIETNILNEIQNNVNEIIQNEVNAVSNENSSYVDLNKSNINEVSQENNQTPYEEQSNEITPLNEVNHELQETRQNDIENDIKAMNLQKETKLTPIAEEIQNKNIERFKDNKNIKFDNVDDLLKLNRRKGYRESTKIEELKNKIKKIGIEEPIEIVQNEDGTRSIQDGNHRLEIAKELGLKEVPIKYVESYEQMINRLENENNNLYNNYSEGDYENANANIYSEISQNNETSGDIIRNSNENSKQFNKIYNEETNTISSEESRYNNRSSSNTENGEINATRRTTKKEKVVDNVKAMNLQKEVKKAPKIETKNSIEEKVKDDVITIKDKEGNKIDLKPTKKGTYERVNTPKTKEVMPKVDFENKTVKVGDKSVSNFYSNITEKSKFIDLDNRIDLMDNDNLHYYDAITNKETLKSAMKNLDTNTEQSIGDFFAKDKFTPEDVATGWILVKRYQDAGNFEAMSKVLEKMREQGTQAGQTVQMYGILQRLTPEGMEYYAQKQLDKAYNEFSKNKSKKQIEKYANDFTLTAEEHQFIKDTMEKVQKLKTDDAKKVEIAKVVQMLSDKLPPEKGSRIKSIMRMSMLGNPKTQVRNVAGNAIIQPVNWVGDIFATVADKAIAKKTGVRTKGNTQFDVLAKGSIQGLKESIRDAKTGVDTRDINLNRFEDSISAKPFYEHHTGKGAKALNTTAKILNKANQALTDVMSGGDRIFYQAVFNNSLENQMKLNKVDVPTQEMIDIAQQEALQRTWNDSNEYTKAVLQIRNAMNKLNVRGYGLGDVLVPFAKTPANLTKAIVDYSPIGLTRTILQDGKNLKNSLQNGQYNAQMQHKFADSLGKGVAGSMLYIAAYALAQAGITSGKSDDDKDVANFMRNTLGIQPYSVKIGNKSFTYDWAQPIAAPFAIMADAKKLSEKENQDLASIIEIATSSASNILLEQSFLSSISDVFNSYEGPTAAIKRQIEDLPARATPTFFKQIADMIDSTSRQTYIKGAAGETLKNKVQVKLPIASKGLESQRDTLGREIKKYGGDDNKLQYAFNVFLNPANTNKGKVSEAAKEIYEVYKATGDKTIMPRQVGYSENIGGTTRNLTAKERNEWQKMSGEKIEENVKALSQNEKYQQMSDEDKASVISGIVNYSFAKSKSELFGTEISTMYKTAAKKEEQGIPLYDYYVDRISKRK